MITKFKINNYNFLFSILFKNKIQTLLGPVLLTLTNTEFNSELEIKKYLNHVENKDGNMEKSQLYIFLASVFQQLFTKNRSRTIIIK